MEIHHTKHHQAYINNANNFLKDQTALAALPVNALIAGEIDYMQYLPFDLLDKLEANPALSLMQLSGVDTFQGNFRLNHASGAFADPAVRRVLWQLVDQDEIMQAIGIPDRYRVKNCPSFWMCGAPLESRNSVAE